MQNIANSVSELFSATVAATRVNDRLKELLATQSVHPRLQQAMMYSTLDSGKRLRAYLAYTTASLYGVGYEVVDSVAAAIEMLQSYSLIHDDLPEMDNSPLRRGKPSCWNAFDSATAILAGDALLTYAFEVIADDAFLAQGTKLSLISLLSKAVGANGMVAGQMYDLISKDTTLDSVIQMQNLKTGVFLGASCEVGAVIGNAPQDRQLLQQFGGKIGLLFQIIDDLLDVEGDSKILGKPIAQDQNKKTFISVLGIKEAKAYTLKIADESYALLERLSVPAPLLVEVVSWILKRQS